MGLAIFVFRKGQVPWDLPFFFRRGQVPWDLPFLFLENGKSHRTCPFQSLSRHFNREWQVPIFEKLVRSVASPMGLALFWGKKGQVPWQVPFLNYPEMDKAVGILGIGLPCLPSVASKVSWRTQQKISSWNERSNFISLEMGEMEKATSVQEVCFLLPSVVSNVSWRLHHCVEKPIVTKI